MRFTTSLCYLPLRAVRCRAPLRVTYHFGIIHAILSDKLLTTLKHGGEDELRLHASYRLLCTTMATFGDDRLASASWPSWRAAHRVTHTANQGYVIKG